MPLVPDNSTPAPPVTNTLGTLVPDSTPAPPVTNTLGTLVPDSTAPKQQTHAPSRLKSEAEAWGSAAIRPVAKAAIYASAFIPDVATSVSNAIGNAGAAIGVFKPEPDVEMTSSFFLRKLDQYTKAPPTGLGRAAENVTAVVLSLGAGVSESAAKTLEEISRKVIKTVPSKEITRITTQAAEDAYNAGFSLAPSYLGRRVLRTAETLAGSAKLHLGNSAKNQLRVDTLAKTSLGLHPEEELNESTFKDITEKAEEKYNAIGAMGQLPPDPLYEADVKAAGGRFAQRSKAFGGKYRYKAVQVEKAHYLDSPSPTAQETVDEVRALRNSSRANFKVNDPEKKALAYTQWQLAEALDNRLARQAATLAKQGAIGKDIYDSYVTARQQLAKINLVRNATEVGGHVNAQALASAKKAGVKLTGGLATIASTAKNFPRDMQYVASKGEEGMFSSLDFLMGGTGLIYSHPLATGLAVARPALRALLKSRAVQKAMIKESPRLKAVARSLARDAAVEVSKSQATSDNSGP